MWCQLQRCLQRPCFIVTFATFSQNLASVDLVISRSLLGSAGFILNAIHLMQYVVKSVLHLALTPLLLDLNQLKYANVSLKHLNGDNRTHSSFLIQLVVVTVLVNRSNLMLPLPTF